MTQKSNATKGFDISKYQTVTSNEKVTVRIAETGDEFEVTVKPMSWSKRNQLISRCLKFSSNGGTNFEADVYVRESLKEMIIDAPWGRTTEAFLISIDQRLGTALEILVPQAFSGDSNDGGGIDSIKKE